MYERIPNRSEFVEGFRNEAVALLLEYSQANSKAAGTNDCTVQDFLPLDWVKRVEKVLYEEGF